MAVSTLPTPAVKDTTFTPLNAVTVTGVSVVYEPLANGSGQWPDNFAWATAVTGAPVTVALNLEGSLDGTNWFQLDQSTSTTGEGRNVVNKKWRYVRINLATLTGGTAPTVTVTLGMF